MNNRKIMVIGAGGSLGSKLCESLVGGSYQVIAVDNDENSVSYLYRIYGVPEKDIYIEDVRNFEKLKIIIEHYDVDIVINCAALKHVMWCEYNIRRAIDINILANLELMNYLSKRNKKFIYISSDKATNPRNIYALTKQFTDYIVKYYKFKLVRGVNFLNSKGSVIDIWETQRKQNKPFTVSKDDCERYFILIDDMVDVVRGAMADNFDTNEYYPNRIFRINIKRLFDAYLRYRGLTRNDCNIEWFSIPLNEKLCEALDFNPDIENLDDIDEIVDIIKLSNGDR